MLNTMTHATFKYKGYTVYAKRLIDKQAKEIQQFKDKIEAMTPLPALKSSPTVSVIIPMYNVEKYIGECLESILYQTFQDFEGESYGVMATDNRH